MSMSLSTSNRGSAGGIVLILLSVLLIVGGYFGYVTYFQKAPTQSLTISNVVGSTFATLNSQDVFLENGKTLTGDINTIFTTTGSRLAVIFPDRSIVRLDASTHIQVKKGPQGNTVITLTKGRLWARILGSAGGEGKVVISLGDSQALVHGTSLEAMKFPLMTKYSVFDSSSILSGEAGIDVIDGSGKVTQVKPENEWIDTLTKESTVRAMNISEAYKNDVFALKSTQEDIVHMQDAIVSYSGDVDIAKAEKEILSSVPSMGTLEFATFFSGTSIDVTDITQNTSVTDWGKVTDKALKERTQEYSAMMQQYESYMNRVMLDQEKLHESLMKMNGQILDQTRSMVDSVIVEQEKLLSDTMMQTRSYLQKVNEDMSTLLQNQEKMTQGIINDTMNSVQSTVENATKGVPTMTQEMTKIDSIVQDAIDDAKEDTSDMNMDMGDMNMDDSTPDDSPASTQGNGSMNMNGGSMNMGNSTSDQSASDDGMNMDGNSMSSVNGGMNMDGNSMSNGDGGMSMGN